MVKTTNFMSESLVFKLTLIEHFLFPDGQPVVGSFQIERNPEDYQPKKDLAHQQPDEHI